VACLGASPRECPATSRCAAWSATPAVADAFGVMFRVNIRKMPMPRRWLDRQR
jgi:hypothetical protein